MSESLSWAERSNTIGYIPGKKKDRLENLETLLRQLPLSSGEAIDVQMASGQTVSTPVDDICGNELIRCALVRRDAANTWVPTEAAELWLSKHDDVALARHLHANVKFFGELLKDLDGTRSKKALLGLASNFGLRWTSTDQLYRRITWMENLGLVERWGMEKFVLTSDGSTFLTQVVMTDRETAVGAPAPAENDDMPTLPDPGETVAAMLENLATQARQRKVLIGYIPRGTKAPTREPSSALQSPLQAIRRLADLIGDGLTTEEFNKRCTKELGLKRSSIVQTLQTMRQMRVFDLIALNEFGVDPDMREIIEPGNEVDMVRFLHARYKFMGELLVSITETTTVPEMVRIANDTYGYGQIENNEIRTRLGFLQEAKLVDRIDWTRYRATPLGRLMAAELPLDGPKAEEAEREVEEAPVDEGVENPEFARSNLYLRLRDFSNRADASTEFESAIADAFRELGFSAQHLGGSGRTDIVVDAPLPRTDRYRAIIDAKASGAGIISDNAVKFDALKDHQKKHRADFGMVVGPDFSERVRDWAVNNKFTLLTVEDLVGLLEKHRRHPLTLSELRMLFEHTGDDLADMEEQYAAAARSSALITKLVELLHQEAQEEDPHLDGFISLDNINYVMRKELSPRPQPTVIEECLQFLSHDLIRAVVKSGSKYKLADSPHNLKLRLAGLGAQLDQIEDQDS